MMTVCIIIKKENRIHLSSIVSDLIKINESPVLGWVVH